MRAIAVGESAAQLDWLWPDATSLQGLSRPLSLASWHHLRHDPAALLLLASTEFQSPGPAPVFRFHHFRAVSSIRRAVRAFDTLPRNKGNHPQATDFLDWKQPLHQPLLHDATRLALFSEAVACYTRRCDPAVAWMGGMLAPLGWFAVASCDPDAVDDCLADPDYEHFALESERELWGFNHAEIARRVGRRMHLPAWLQVLVGHLDLSRDSIQSLGGNPELVATVRVAIELAQRSGQRLRLLTRSHLDDDLRNLGLDADDFPAIESRFRESDTGEYLSRTWQDPRDVPLLSDLLQACLGDRLLCGPDTEAVEREVDQLHVLVHQQERSEQCRLEDSRIASLAEFAAGAAHEINNPLAVISGQSQFLLKAELDESRRDSLQAIIRQVNRIHGILTEVMQFARPTRPQQRLLPVADDLQAAVDQVMPLAESKKVTLEYQTPGADWTLSLDGKQMQTVYAALIRNAVEAAPAGGWVRVSVTRVLETIEVAVEDNGPGLSDLQRRHAFDPFYSGRPAGRGRGFGLPIAWRLAKENGGEVRHESRPGEPTRFVVRLPLHAGDPQELRQSA